MKKYIGKIIGVMALVIALAVLAQLSFAEGEKNSEGGGKSATVTVYFTVSNDGDFVTGADGTVMARVPVTLSYYDLAEYGLEDFYRYEAAPFEDGGEYIGTTVIERPTLLHMYIRALEKHYALHKLSNSDVHSDIIDITGSATHLYMKRFWGHDENLMYFVDHAYPLQAPGWGSTCDYILLEDGMEIDLAMFTDWDFYKTGAFASFDKTSSSIKTGENINLRMVATATRPGADGNTAFVGVPMPQETVRVSKDQGKTWERNVGKTNKDGIISLSFKRPGIYYISGGPKFVNYPDVAPPISVINVTGKIKDDDPVPGGPDNADFDLPVPKNLKVKVLGNEKAVLTWNKVAGADNYIVAYREKGKQEWITATVAKTEFLFENLEKSKTYETAVKARGKKGEKTAESRYSDTVTFSASQGNIPQDHQKKTKQPVTSSRFLKYNTVLYKWKPVKGEKKYIVAYKKGKKGSWDYIKTKKKKYIFYDLKDGEHYLFKVKPYDEDSYSKITEMDIIRAPVPKIRQITATSMLISWKPVPGADGYRVMYREGRGKWKTKLLRKRKWHRTKLHFGINYSYRVASYVKSDSQKFFSGYKNTIKTKTK